MTRALIVALGNPFAADDGVGAALARALAPAAGVNCRIEVERGDASNLRNLWQGEEEVWLIDAVDFGMEPGRSRLLTEAEILRLPQRHDHAHHLSLPECLRWLRLGCPEMAAVRIRLLGVQPGSLSFGAPLSPAVRSAVPRLARRFRRLLPPPGPPAGNRRGKGIPAGRKG
ncbi:MAG: hydrogenase maturation protease [Candidatus Eisenbacteria bacterium]